VNKLQKNIEAYCLEHHLIDRGDTLVIGVSGGPDSVCLLAVFKAMAPAYKLRLHVAHLNHGLRGQDADDDAAYVADLARQWQLPCTIQKEDVRAFAQQHKLNLEDAARHRRYHFLAQVARNTGATKIAVAHNANDQAETVLMHFLRGSGVSGLRGMRPSTPLTDLEGVDTDVTRPTDIPLSLIRPLLETPRALIEDYCRTHQLAPRLDASNRDPTLLRNKVRHQLLPLLETYNPNIYRALGKTAALMSADYEILQNELDRAWPTTLKSQTDNAVILDREAWQNLPLALQRGVLRQALQALRQNLSNIGFDHIDQAIKLLKKGQTGSQLDFPGAVNLTVAYHEIRLTTSDYRPPASDQPRISPETIVPLDLPGATPLPGTDWVLHTTLVRRNDLLETSLKPADPWQAYFDAAKVGPKPILRSRRGGDKFYPLGMHGHSQRLKDFMINQKIPAAERAHIPLLVSETGLVCWICGWRTDHLCRVTADTEQVLGVRFQKSSQ
jgi:tRNA(Ile)-lysidine synthase